MMSPRSSSGSRSVGLGDGWNLGVGGSVSMHRIDQALEPIHGERPRSYISYMMSVRLDLES
jgi:hypothetical protein